MLPFLNSFVTKPRPQTRSEFARTFDFRDRPFTQSCVYLACYLQDQTFEKAKQNFGVLDRTKGQENSLFEIAISSAQTVAKSIVSDAANQNGLEPYFPPHNETPKHAPYLLAFALAVTTGLQIRIEKEGIDLDGSLLAANLMSSFFPTWKADRATPVMQEGQALFDQLCRPERRDLNEWVTNVAKMSSTFVDQWPSTNEEFKRADIKPVIAVLLKNLLDLSNRPVNGNSHEQGVR